MNIGATLKRLRLERNLTIKKVSEATGFSQSVISEYEKNITTPSLNRFFSLIDFYGVNALTMIYQGRELVDITDFSPTGKQKIHEITMLENKKTLR